MVKVINTVIDNEGKCIGYRINEDGFEYDLLPMCLYNASYFYNFIESGYKFYDYNPSNIEDLNGNKISDLPAVDSEFDEDVMFGLEEMAREPLSESECSKYYSYHTNNIIEFLTPPSEAIKYHTREELIEYLETIGGQVDRHGYSTDYKPLNYFVAKEALFSCDEIRKDSKIRSLFECVNKRHSLRNITDYLDIVNWLFDKGVLKTKTPTYLEFLSAYYSWGIDGIRDSCISLTSKQAVDGVFKISNETINISDHLINRSVKYILFDKNYKAHYLRSTTDMSDIQTFGRERIVLSGEESLFKAKKKIDSWESQYKVIKGYVSRISDRMYLGFISEEGYPYQFKITHNEFIMFSSSETIINTGNFSIGSIRRGIKFTLDNVSSVEDYYLWNLALAKAEVILKDRSVETPVKSSYDLLIKEGINPKAAISVLVNNIYHNREYVSNNYYKDQYGRKANYVDAFDRYCKKIPDDILSKCGISEDNFEDIDDFIDSISDLESSEDAMYLGNQESKASSSIIGLIDSEVKTDFKEYYEDISFIRSCFNNEVIINNMGDGKIDDTSTALLDILDIILTCTYTVNGSNSDIETLEEYIKLFEEKAPFDLDKTFRVRDAMYKGYIKDLMQIRGQRGYGATAWAYCTRVYREISNAPLDEQRHYAMEICCVEDRVLRQDVRNCIWESVKLIKEEDIKDLLLTEIYYLAANLFFYILARQVTDSDKQGSLYKVSIPTGFVDVNSLEVIIPEGLYNTIRTYDKQSNTKYITLYDYCNIEFDEGAFKLFLVNANVTPWRVTPKPGFGIKSYNFMLNYNREAAFNRFSEEWRNEVDNTEARVIGEVSISEMPATKFIISLPLDDKDKPDNYDYETISIFLDETIYEPFAFYKRRWMLCNNEAKKSNLILKTMLLKQDVIWGSIAKYCNESVDKENVLVDPSQLSSNNYITTVKPDTLSHKNLFITSTSSSRITRKLFDIRDFDFNTIMSWSKLLSGSFNPSEIIFMCNSNVTIKDASGIVEVKIIDITREVLENWTNRNLCYQLDYSRFLIKALNGDYVIEI